jgi:hypothetical protein
MGHPPQWEAFYNGIVVRKEKYVDGRVWVETLQKACWARFLDDMAA